MTWKKSILGDYCFTLNERNYFYEATMGKLANGYILNIIFEKGKLRKGNDFYSRAYCKTISQAKQLEALTRLNIMEIYL